MIFGRKERRSPKDPEERLEAHLDRAFQLVMQSTVQASRREVSVVVSAVLFEFVQTLDERVTRGSELMHVLSDDEKVKHYEQARAIFRRTDPLVQSMLKKDAMVAIPILTDAYAKACEAEIAGLAASPLDRMLDDEIVTSLSTLLAEQARTLPRSVKKKHVPEFEKLGSLTFVCVWILTEWLNSSERRKAQVSSEDVLTWTQFVDSYKPFAYVPVTGADLLEGLPTPAWLEEHPRDSALSWLEMVTNGYLAFQAGQFGHCVLIYALAEVERSLPRPRQLELDYAQSQVKGAPPSAAGEALSVSSEERLAFLADGLTFDPDFWTRHDSAPQETRDLVDGLAQMLDSEQAASAADELIHLSGSGVVSPETRALLAAHLVRMNRREDALHQLQYLVTVPVEYNEMARSIALGQLSMILYMDERYGEALGAVREALRCNFSNAVALLILSKLETTLNLDFPMSTLLELRVMGIDELKGKAARAEVARERIRKKPPYAWAYGFDYSTGE